MELSRKEALGLIGLSTLGLLYGTPVFAMKNRKKVAELNKLKPLKPITFNYPDEESPAILIDMGEPAYMGVGPRRSIVAFSSLCQHMGCPVQFDSKERLLVCPCHLSMFDPARGGVCIEGPAISRLPIVALEISGNDIFAVGIAQGVVYGRAKNF